MSIRKFRGEFLSLVLFIITRVSGNINVEHACIMTTVANDIIMTSPIFFFF